MISLMLNVFSLFHRRMDFSIHKSLFDQTFFVCHFQELTTWAKLFLVKPLFESWAVIGCGRPNAKLVIQIRTFRGRPVQND